jgi:hypothetical protein
MLPILPRGLDSRSSIPRRRGRVALRGLFKVPLAQENPLRIQAEGDDIGIPRLKSYRRQIGPRTSLYRQLLAPTCPFWEIINSH